LKKLEIKEQSICLIIAFFIWLWTFIIGPSAGKDGVSVSMPVSFIVTFFPFILLISGIFFIVSNFSNRITYFRYYFIGTCFSFLPFFVILLFFYFPMMFYKYSALLRGYW